MTRKQIVGSAVPTTLSAPLSSGALSFALVAQTGWPSGGSYPFEVIIDRLGTAEKILCDSRSGATVTVNSSGRGYDGTSDVSHLAGVTVEICITAATVQEANEHTNDITRNDHTQYMRKAQNLADVSSVVTARDNLGVEIGVDVQAFDTDLGVIAGLTPTNDDILQRKSGAWANRTIAQLITDLGLVANYQPLDAELTAIAGLTSAADRLAYFTGSGTAALATLTSAARALLDDADASTMLTTLGLSTFVKTLMDDTTAAAFLTTLGVSAFAQTVLDDADAAAARATLDAAQTLPAGLIAPYAGSAAPTGWLLCAGTSELRATYPALFTAIGTTYGSADGTHFTLPDLRGRVPISADNMGGSDAGRLASANTLGTAGGEETHTLTEAEMPSHTHVINYANAPMGNGAGNGLQNGIQTAWVQTAITAANTGGGGAHSNMQPFLTMNSIIKT